MRATPMTSEQLAEIRALHSAVTPGEWEMYRYHTGDRRPDRLQAALAVRTTPRHGRCSVSRWAVTTLALFAAALAFVVVALVNQMNPMLAFAIGGSLSAGAGWASGKWLDAERSVLTTRQRVAIETWPTELVLLLKDGDEHGWDEEFAWLDANHAAQLWALAASVKKNGMREPILVGPDQRVWDGHHRIRVAALLNLPTIPVKVLSGSAS